MTWKISAFLTIALPLCAALGQADFPTGSDSATNSRLSEEKLEERLGKIDQERVISERLAAAAEVRQRRAQAGN